MKKIKNSNSRVRFIFTLFPNLVLALLINKHAGIFYSPANKKNKISARRKIRGKLFPGNPEEHHSRRHLVKNND
jgi:hypothetical protein